jgi:antitoxin MazE
VRTRIIRIGRSHGVRIPKPLLEQAGLKGEVEISAAGSTLVIGPAVKARAGWDAAFKEMAGQGDDDLMDGGAPSFGRWDEDEWEW